MKKLLCILLALTMVLALCACAGNGSTESTPAAGGNTEGSSQQETEESVEQSIPETTEQSVPETTVHEHTYEEKVTKEATCSKKGEKTFTCACGDSYTESIKKLSHKYTEATCSAPKTCSVCGKTDGKAKAHDYEGGKCTVCGDKQKNYKKLDEGHWVAYAVDGETMEELELFFDEEGTGFFSVAVYGKSSMMIDAGEVVLDGVTWYEEGFGYSGDVTYTEKGNTVVADIDGRGQQGTITLERTAGNKLKVTKVTGIIIDEIITKETKVGTVYTWTELNYE